MSAPRLIALIRHGAYHQRPGAPSALQPFPLTEEGAAQARACGAEIAALLAQHGAALDPVIHCSPQLRAWATARAIGDQLEAAGQRVDLRETEALSERSVGSAANLTAAEIEAVLAADPRYEAPPPGWKSDSHYRLPLPGAESLMQAGARVAAHLRATIEPDPTPGKLTLFVGHGASIRHGAHHLGVLPFGKIAQISMYHARPLLLCYSPHDSWRHFAGAWKIRPADRAPMD